MSAFNFEAHYEPLTEVQADERFMRLCTMQQRELSELTAKHANQRVRLALAIRREQDERENA